MPKQGGLLPGEWFDILYQALEYRQEYGNSKEWSSYRDYYRGNFQNYGRFAPVSGSAGILPYNLTYAMARVVVPNVYFRNPYITVSQRFKPGHEIHAKVVEAVDNWLIQEINFKQAIKTAVLDCFLCGRGILKLGYDSQYGYSQSQTDPFGQSDETATSFAGANPDKEKPEKIEYNVNIKPGMPFIVRVDPDMFLVPFGCRNLQEAEWVDHVVVRRLDDLKKDKKYKNTSNLNGSHISRIITDSNKQEYYEELQKHHEWAELHEIHDAKYREVFGLVPSGDIGDGAFVRGPEPDLLQVDGLPFVDICFNEDPEYYWSPSDAKLMEPQQLEMNEARTQAMLHRRISLVKFLVDEGAIEDEEIAKMLSEAVGPCVKVKGSPGDKVSLLQPSMPPDLVQWPDVIRGDVREMMGLGRQQMGENARSHTTATESQIVQRAHELRMDERRDAVADAVTQVVRKLNQTIFSFWDTSRVVQVVGYDGAKYWVEYEAEAIKGEYDLSVDVESLTPTTKSLKRQELVKLIEALGNNPRVNIDYLLRTLLREFEYVDAMKVLPEAPEMQQLDGQAMPMGQFEQIQGKMLSNPQVAQQRSSNTANQLKKLG